MLNIIYFINHKGERIVEEPFLQHQLEHFEVIQKKIPKQNKNETGTRIMNIEVDDNGKFSPLIIKRALAYATDPLFVRTEFISHFHNQHDGNKKWWGCKAHEHFENDYTYTRNENCFYSSEGLPTYFYNSKIEINNDDIQAIEWAKYMNNPYLAYTIIHNYDVILPELWETSIHHYTTKRPTNTLCSCLLDVVIMKLYIPYYKWLASFKMPFLNAWSYCVIARFAILYSRNYSAIKNHSQREVSMSISELPYTQQLEDFIFNIRNKILSSTGLFRNDIFHLRHETTENDQLIDICDWDNNYYSFADQDDKVIDIICYDASNIEYKNIKSNENDICFISKNKIKPNIDVWRCSKCGCVVSLTNKGLLGYLRKYKKKGVPCPCPKKCGNSIQREDGYFKHSHHLNAIQNSGRLLCPVSLCFEAYNPQLEKKNTQKVYHDITSKSNYCYGDYIHTQFIS